MKKWEDVDVMEESFENWEFKDALCM